MITGQSSHMLFISSINMDFMILIFKDFYIKFKFKNLTSKIDILGIFNLVALDITFIS